MALAVLIRLLWFRAFPPRFPVSASRLELANGKIWYCSPNCGVKLSSGVPLEHELLRLSRSTLCCPWFRLSSRFPWTSASPKFPEYFAIIEHPVSVLSLLEALENWGGSGTVKSGVDQDKEILESFARSVRRMWEDCAAYHHEGSKVRGVVYVP